MSEHEREKTHHECKCSGCDRITAMAERIDAWKAAESLLLRNPDGSPRKWGGEDDDLIVGPDNVLLLSNWLLYGPEEDD